MNDIWRNVRKSAPKPITYGDVILGVAIAVAAYNLLKGVL